MTFVRLLIVGFGTMTGAMVDGWLRAGYPASRFEVYHPRRTQVARGLTVHNEWPAHGASGTPYDAVLLGVKPHMLDEVAGGIGPLLGAETVLLTVLAGLPIAAYRERFRDAGAIVRLMPNLASAIGKSPNALFGVGLSDLQKQKVTQLAQDIGTAEWLDDEAQFDLVTALAGSGPGFVYRFIDALAAGGAGFGAGWGAGQPSGGRHGRWCGRVGSGIRRRPAYARQKGREPRRNDAEGAGRP